MGAVKMKKNDEDRPNTTQSKQFIDYEVNSTSLRDIGTFLKKRGTISSTKTSTLNNVVELSDDQ